MLANELDATPTIVSHTRKASKSATALHDTVSADIHKVLLVMSGNAWMGLEGGTALSHWS